LDDGKFKTLKYADTQEKPYIVTAATHSPNLVNGVMNTVSVWFNRLWKNDIQTQPLHVLDGDAGTPPMSMYVFKGKNAKLIAGVRELHLAWYGGKSPYQIQVFQIGAKKRLWDEKESATIEITFKKQQFTAGRYQVVVTDTQGKDVVAEFTAVTDAPSQDSKEAQAIEQSNLPAQSKKTLLAVLLAKQEGWYFEAYQRVASITGYYPAQLVKQGLERGKPQEW